MTNIRKLWLLGALAFLGAACDPYDDEKKGQPTVLSVFAVGGNSDDAATAISEGVVDASGVWTIRTKSTCTGAVAAVPAEGTCEGEDAVPENIGADAQVIWVKANKPLDGASIEQVPQTCSPTNGWLTATVSLGGATVVDDSAAWFTCYNPATSTAAEGGAVVLYNGQDLSHGSWLDQGAATPVSKEDLTTYTLKGQVADKQGNPFTVDVKLEVEPDAGEISLSRAVTSDTTATISWDPAACGTASAYKVFSGETEVTPPGGQTALEYEVTEMITGECYEYTVVPVVHGNVTGQDFEGKGETITFAALQPPTAPTITNITSSGATISWTAIAGATSYDVQRAPAAKDPCTGAEIVGSFLTRANTTALTYVETGLTANATYHWRIVARSECGQSANGVRATMQTLP